MAKINNVGLNLGQKIANPFKTSRNSTTNPFKYSNFEGNTLQFADVFEGFEPQKNTGKLKMISSSVAGSMTKLKSLLPESIVNFVNRVREGVSNAWNYAKNTNISDVKGIKTINEVMNADILELGKGISDSVSTLGKGISDKMSFLNKDVREVGKDLSDKMAFLNTDVAETELGKKWNALISKIIPNKITKDKSVDELKAMWEAEIAASTKEAA